MLTPRKKLIAPPFLVVCLLAGATAFGCGGPSATDSEAATEATPVAPEPLEVTAASDQFIFSFLSADETSIARAVSADGVPEASRAQVVVMPRDPNMAPPAGWEYVADLRSPLPLTVQAVRGFNLETRAPKRKRQPNQAVLGATKPVDQPTEKSNTKVKEASNKRVSMFTSPGCSFCDKARNYLEKHRISFSEYDLERDGRRAQQKLGQLAQRAGIDPRSLSGVPIVFVGKHVVRGFDRRRLNQLLGI